MDKQGVAKMSIKKRIYYYKEVYRGYKELPKAMTMPKVPIIYNILNGKYHLLWLVHDLYYGVDSGVTRHEADKELFRGIRRESPGLWGLVFGSTVYLAVRAVGWYHYNTKD